MPTPNAHGSFLRIVTSLTRPVSAAGVPPVAISHGNLLRIVTAPPVPGIGGQWPLTMRTVAFCDSLLPRPARYRRPVAADNAHGGFLRFVTALTRPVSLLRCSRCLGQSPPCQRGVPRHRRGGGIPQAGRFPHRLVLLESACCESLSRLRRQLPLTREPFCARYRSIVRYRAFSSSQSTAWDRSTQKPQPKTGARAEPPHPSQSEGSISRWLGGILKTNY